MRLICGLMRLDGGAASPSLLSRMVAQMDVPRLRPGRSEFRDGAVAIAMLDFSTPAAGSLPALGASVMAADVRLDEIAGLAQSRDLGDQDQGALLLDVVNQAGVQGLECVHGDFAFAAWNGETQTLTCGRDIFGVRPFYYVHRPGDLFAFASLPSALYGSGIVPKKIDTNALVRRAMRSASFEDSLIEGIVRLPPAHALDVSRQGISLRRYWQLDRAKVGTARVTPEEAARELRRRVDQAVRSRLPKGAKLGSHLSGGLDSSAVAILAARALREEGRTLHAYSFLDRLRNDVQLEDETEFVKACVEQEGDIDWEPVRAPIRDFEQDVPVDPDLLHALGPDDPDNQVAAIAERQGVDLILSGWGGDEAATFNGRGTMAELLKRGHWRALTREIDALAKERQRTRRGIFLQEVVSYLADELVPAVVVRLARRVVGKAPGYGSLLHDMLSPTARRTLNDVPALPMVGDGRKNRWRLINSPHIALRAEGWAQTGARHGVAYAFPLLDRRVVEFALSLPSEFFLSGGFRRRAFRDAMQGVLPETVRRRHQKYMPFPGIFLDLAESRDALLARIAALKADANVRDVLDLAQLQKMAAKFPSPDETRQEVAEGGNPQGMWAMFAVGEAVALATYLEEHGTKDQSAVPARNGHG